MCARVCLLSQRSLSLLPAEWWAVEIIVNNIIISTFRFRLLGCIIEEKNTWIFLLSFVVIELCVYIYMQVSLPLRSLSLLLNVKSVTGGKGKAICTCRPCCVHSSFDPLLSLSLCVHACVLRGQVR